MNFLEKLFSIFFGTSSGDEHDRLESQELIPLLIADIHFLWRPCYVQCCLSLKIYSLNNFFLRILITTCCWQDFKDNYLHFCQACSRFSKNWQRWQGSLPTIDVKGLDYKITNTALCQTVIGESDCRFWWIWWHYFCHYACKNKSFQIFLTGAILQEKRSKSL